MNRALFFLKRLFQMDFHRFSKMFREIQARSGKSVPWLVTDMLRCALRYNAGYMDYKIAEMYRLNDQQKSTVITRGISNDIVRRMNDKAYWYVFDDKGQFNTRFAEWINRDWMVFDEHTSIQQLSLFIQDKETMFVKPIEGSSGVGVMKMNREEMSNPDALLEKLKSLGKSILEETVIQHPDMSRLNASSVNTLRFATLIGDKQAGIVYCFLRIGNGKVMDNVDCGGMACRVDLETGVILTPGCDKAGHVYDVHPLTGTKFEGFKIPFFEEAKQMCLQAMRVEPHLRFIAWDVAVTESGPVFIEGNSFPSHAVPQFAGHYPDGIGILPEFRKFIDC